jgi:hypothetical protein
MLFYTAFQIPEPAHKFMVETDMFAIAEYYIIQMVEFSFLFFQIKVFSAVHMHKVND